jgi:N-acetylglucosamine-6-sulfatase
MAALVAVCALPTAAGAQAPERPNVVMIMTDDMTAHALRFMPQVKRLLMDRGTTFERSFVSFPLCCPSRATYLSGQYAHNHHVLHNAGPHGGYRAFDHTNALPVWLQRGGYHTINLGRYLNGYGVMVPPETIPPGWSDWNAAVDPSTFNYAHWQMNQNGTILDYPLPLFPDEYQTDFYGRRAAELVTEAAPLPGPFFLSLTVAAPHSGRPRDPDDPSDLPTPSPAPRHRDLFAGLPLPRPPNFNEADVSDKPQVVSDHPLLSAQKQGSIEENYRQELESLQSVDDAVARLVNALQSSGQLDNTLVVFTSDNGFMHGEHRFASEKVLPYEEAIRVPLVMRGPGVPVGHKDRRMVANIDWAPTILDAANVAPGRTEDGRSLLPLLADPTKEWGRDLLLENGQGANGVPWYKGIRTYRYKYIVHSTTGEEELYDLRRDPYELRNLAYQDRYTSLRLELARRLRRLRSCRGARCRARPRLGVMLRGRTHRARCVAGNLKVGTFGPDSRQVTRLVVSVGGRRVARAGRPPFRALVRRRRLARGRQSLLRVQATTRDGRVVTLDRHLTAC